MKEWRPTSIFQLSPLCTKHHESRPRNKVGSPHLVSSHLVDLFLILGILRTAAHLSFSTRHGAPVLQLLLVFPLPPTHTGSPGSGMELG